MTKEELIAKVREVAARLGGKPLMQKDFFRESGIALYWVQRYFDGWGELCAAAGIEPGRAYNLSDEQILAALRDAILDLGGLGTMIQMLRRLRFNRHVLYTRWGSYPSAIRALRDWLLEHDPKFRYLEQLDQYLATRRVPGRSSWRNQRKRAAAAKRAAVSAPEPVGDTTSEPIGKTMVDTAGEPGSVPHPSDKPPCETPRETSSEPSGEPSGEPAADPAAEPPSRPPAEPSHTGHGAAAPRPLVGEVIAYRGVMFAPTNEMGVVVLFAVAAEALGFVIEAVGTAFPDCSAWRRIACGRFEHLRLEFEFASSNFRAHRHDAKGCALLVCWEHDWPACPVPVLDLKKAIARLKREAAESGR